MTDIAAIDKTLIPTTEGIKYAGSKLKILPSIVEVLNGLKVKTVFDGFSGSTRVSQAFAQLGYHTTSNDISIWSETFATCFLLNKQPAAYYAEMITHLNALKGYDGWFTEHYGGNTADGGKQPFQRKNTQKLDAIRDEIDKMQLGKVEKAVALTSLILALDSVDNTLGHYAAYLAEWSPRSHKNLMLKVPHLFLNSTENEVLRGDVFEAVKNRVFDFAYLDPPYGSNNEKMPPSRVRYASYYHIWKTIILNDKPLVFGKAARREDTRDQVAASVFEEFRKDDSGHFIAMQAIKKLIDATQAKYILLSYSSGGRATKAELTSIINTSGKLIKAIEINYKHHVMASMRWTNEWINSNKPHCEFLFLMEKF
ncbi:MAG: DNA adenine methylase [Chitinophagales bacterium]